MNDELSVLNRWWRLAGGFTLILCLGSLYAIDLFVQPMREELGWGARQTSLILAFGILCFALSVVPSGRLQDRFGPALSSYAGAILLSLGFFAASFASSLTWVYISLGGLVGIGNGLGYTTPIPVAAKWFPDRRGLAIGIVVAGYPAAALIHPVAGYLINTFGWRVALRLFSGLLLLIGLAGAALLQNPPAQWASITEDRGKATTSETQDYSFLQTLLTGRFYNMWLSYCLGATANLILISQLIPFAASGIQNFSPQQARLAVVIGAVANASARVFFGWLSDVWGRMRMLVLAMLLSTFACALAPSSGELSWFYVMAFCAYWGYGSLLSLFPSMTADAFGVKNLGVDYGLVFTAWTLAAILGPTLGGRIVRTTGDYSSAFYAAAILSVIALGLLLLLGRLKHRNAA